MDILMAFFLFIAYFQSWVILLLNHLVAVPFYIGYKGAESPRPGFDYFT
jgi:hypothetical protein